MNRHLLKFIYLTLFLIAPQSIFALTAEDYITVKVGNDDLYFTLDETNKIATLQLYTVVSGRKTDVRYYTFESLTIPAKVTVNNTDYTVKLGERALYKAEKLKTLVIPEGITEIPDRFAAECTALESVTLPEGLVSIGHALDPFDASTNVSGGAFEFTAIRDIKIPNSVKVIGDNTFTMCRSLVSCTLGESTEVIGRTCFDSCDQLETVNFPKSLKRINTNAFYGCSKLSEISLPEGLNHIGAKAFQNTAITSIIIPESLSVIRSFLFYNLNIETLTIPAGVERILPRALAAKSLKKLIIADSEKTLDFDLKASNKFGRDPWTDDYAQETDAIGCWLPSGDATTNNLTDIYIGRNISVWVHPDYVPSKAGDPETNPLAGLEQLENIVVGAEVTDASMLAFEDYPSLKTITFLCPTAPAVNTLTPEQAANVKVIVPEGASDSYSQAGWNTVLDFTESGIDSIIVSDSSNAEPEYYDLRGQRIANPSNGIYIKRTGNKVEKVLL